MRSFQKMEKAGTSSSTLTATKSVIPMVSLANQNPIISDNIAQAATRTTKPVFSLKGPPKMTQATTEVHTVEDEYGHLTSEGSTFICENFKLENGIILPQAQLRYRSFGEINRSRDNVVVVCHALTGNASLDEWWGGLLGPDKAFDTQKYCVVCCNILGSCYGSTGPTSINPSTGRPYLKDFPDISVRDTVRMQLLFLKEELKATSIKCVIGGSFGGMQAMEFAVQAGSAHGEHTTISGGPYVRSVVAIACGSAHAAWQIAFSESQRQAIYADANWDTNPLEAKKGLAVARQIAMISYRSYKGYQEKFGRKAKTNTLYGSSAQYEMKSYLEYQGQKFIPRFDPITYIKMTEQMDSHNVGRNRGGIASALQTVHIPVMVMGIDSDILYPLREQEEMVSLLPNAELRVIHSDAGHDGFLLEQDQVGQNVTSFLESDSAFMFKKSNL